MEHPLLAILFYFSIFAGIGYLMYSGNKWHEEEVKARRQELKNNHREYMTSEWWQERKREYFNMHERACAICGTSSRVDLHHKSYSNLHAERDYDLVPLCRLHHNAFHTSGYKLSDTDSWIQDERTKIATAGYLANNADN